MRYISIIILLVLSLTLLLLTGCVTNTITPEIASGNLENQEDINQSSNNFQSSSISPIYEPVTEEPVIEEDTEEEVIEDPGTVYPQKWATGDGTVGDPWANDCIKKALDFATTDGTIYLRAGYYQLAGALTITKPINIIGEGMNKTIIKTAGGTVDGFHSDGADYISIKNLTIDGDAQEDNTEWQAVIGFDEDCNYVLCENLEVMNGGYYGIDYYEGNHSLFKNIYAHDNYRHGLHAGSDTTEKNMYNTYRDIYAWDNGGQGLDDRGSIEPIEQLNNVYGNIQCWDNGGKGIAIGLQKAAVLSNSSSSGNVHGIYLYDMEDFDVHDCFFTLNENNGLRVARAENINFTNVIVKNNNVLDTITAGKDSGIFIHECSNIVLTSCQSYDDRDIPLQNYGVYLSSEINTGISLLNCKLTPNENGDIYNPNSVVITVITEKMLAKF